MADGCPTCLAWPPRVRSGARRRTARRAGNPAWLAYGVTVVVPRSESTPLIELNTAQSAHLEDDALLLWIPWTCAVELLKLVILKTGAPLSPPADP